MQVVDALQLEADEPEEHSPLDERAIDGLGVVLAVRREDVAARAAVEQVLAYQHPSTCDAAYVLQQWQRLLCCMVQRGNLRAR